MVAHRAGAPGFGAAAAGKRAGMGYAFAVDETVPDGVRRIAAEQVDRAVAELEGAGDDDFGDVVHASRKRAKKLRGLLRLVRPALGPSYSPANEAFRDAGRELSATRDAQAILATFDDLVAAPPGDRWPTGGLDAVRSGLAARAEAAGRGDDREAVVERAVERFRAGGDQVARAHLDAGGWAAIGPGLVRAYRSGRGRRAEVAEVAPARHDAGAPPEVVHEWRKRAKDAWYHVRLLRRCAPSVLDPLDHRFHDLSDALGDAHDLVVVTEQLQAEPDRFGGEGPVRAAVELAAARRAELERRAVLLGARLYAEKPKAYAARLGAYWRAWHESGAEEPVGALADLFPPADDPDG